MFIYNYHPGFFFVFLPRYIDHRKLLGKYLNSNIAKIHNDGTPNLSGVRQRRGQSVMIWAPKKTV